MNKAVARAVALACVTSIGSPVAGAPGLKCSVKVAKKDGLVSVTARGVVGTLFWGAKAGEETSAFFNAGACAKGANWRKCLLGDPVSVAARTPPGDCTLYLRDDAGSCTAWVPGCTPGLRTSSEGPVEPELAAALARIDVLEATVTSLQTDLADVNAAVMGAAAVKDTVDAHTAQLAELDTLAATVNGNTTSINSLNSSVDTHTAQLTELDTLAATVNGNTASINSLSSMVALHTTYITNLDAKTRCISASLTVQGKIYFENCNVYIANGTRETYTKNGLGNLIIGYDESLPAGADEKSGSHNLVIGKGHSYTGIAGFVAGEDNAIAGFAASVSGGMANRASGNWASISGGSANVASGNASSVGGGNENVANTTWASVSGGWKNTASGEYASVSGGQENVASGEVSSISGGARNAAKAEAAAVTGGDSNLATGVAASVTGGDHNEAAGRTAVITGGFYNAVTGESASVAGGGYNSVGGGGATIAGGAGITANPDFTFAAGESWFQTVTITSDRKEKEAFTSIAPAEVLGRVVSLPIGEWQYKSQPGVRHVGPMAQDFRAAFQVGVTDKGIATVDADGVALAAIQGLHELVEQQQSIINELSLRLDAYHEECR